MHVLVRLQFQHGQPAVRCDGEQVEHAPVACLEGRHLRIDMGGVELCQRSLALCKRADVLAQRAFEPRLGCHAEERVFRRAAAVPPLEESRDQIPQHGFGFGQQPGFVRARAKGDLADRTERIGRDHLPNPCELQPVQQQGHLRRGAQPRLHRCPHGCRNKLHDGGQRGCKTLPGALRIGRVKQLRGKVSGVGRVALG